MIPSRGDDKRRIVPRWRSPQATVEAGEFATIDQATSTSALAPSLERELAESLDQWRDRPSLGTAAEVIASASMSGREREAAEAGEFVVDRKEQAGPLLLERAEHLLNSIRDLGQFPRESSQAATGLVISSHAEARSQIAPLKSRVRADPRDALAWLEMGRLHATQGNFNQAMRAVRVAHTLAPQSRYVLRSASRFYLHAGRPDLAADVISRSPRSRQDPWLSAAEIAAQQVSGNEPRTLRYAREILQAGEFNDHDLSELRSALATTSLIDGRRRDAKRLLQESLRRPTENAVAQALWIARAGDLHGVSNAVVGGLETPRSFEARSMASYNKGEWADALKQAWFWYEDEPFSGRAVVHVSVLEAVAFERYDVAIRILEAGLRASPGQFLLQTNLVYNLAKIGRVDEAKILLRGLHAPSGDISGQVVLLANWGLIQLRSGGQEAGRRAYQDAIELAQQEGLKDLAEQAALYFALEELSSKNRSALPLAEELLAAAKRQKPAEVRIVHVRLQRLVDQLRKE